MAVRFSFVSSPVRGVSHFNQALQGPSAKRRGLSTSTNPDENQFGCAVAGRRSVFADPADQFLSLTAPPSNNRGIDPVKRRSMKLGDARPIAGAGRCPLGAAARTERLEGRDGRGKNILD